MQKIALSVEYDGSAFHGWQRQPNVKTVQSALEETLKVITREDVTDVTASGRTDAGVHARGQVVTFSLRQPVILEQLAISISSIMRGELAVVDACFVDESFHPRFSAKSKLYCYTVLNRSAPPVLDRGRVWHVREPIDVDHLASLAREFAGRHDFRAFQAADCNAQTTVREILRSEIRTDPPYLFFLVEGEGFLKNMVRIMMGTMIDLAQDRLKRGSIGEVLSTLDRSEAGQTAPAQGLTLEAVRYDPPLFR